MLLVSRIGLQSNPALPQFLQAIAKTAELLFAAVHGLVIDTLCH